MSEPWAERSEQRGIRPRANVVEHLLVCVRPALRVNTEGDKDNRRAAWKARDAAQEARNGHLVGPDKRHATLKSREPGLELLAPEPADVSVPNHQEDLPGFGEYAQDVIDQARKIVDDRDRSLVLAKRRAAEESLIHRGEKEGPSPEKAPADTCVRIQLRGRR